MKQEIDKEWLARNFSDIVNDYCNIYDSLPKEKVMPLVLASDIITKYAMIHCRKERTKKAWKNAVQAQLIAEIKNYKRFFFRMTRQQAVDFLLTRPADFAHMA